MQGFVTIRQNWGYSFTSVVTLTCDFLYPSCLTFHLRLTFLSLQVSYTYKKSILQAVTHRGISAVS